MCTAPVWISEFGIGGCGNADPESRAWFETFMDRLAETNVGLRVLADSRLPHGRLGWRRLVHAPSRTGAVDPVVP